MKRIYHYFGNQITALALAGALVGTAVAFTQKPKAEQFNPPPVDQTPIPRELGGHTSFAPVVKKVAPGVVKIFTTTKARNMSFNGGPGGDMDDFFRRFFGDQFQGRMRCLAAPCHGRESSGLASARARRRYVAPVRRGGSASDG